MTKQDLQKIFHEAEKKVSSPENWQRTLDAAFKGMDPHAMSREELIGRVLYLSQRQSQKFMFEVMAAAFCIDSDKTSFTSADE